MSRSCLLIAIFLIPTASEANRSHRTVSGQKRYDNNGGTLEATKDFVTSTKKHFGRQLRRLIKPLRNRRFSPKRFFKKYQTRVRAVPLRVRVDQKLQEVSKRLRSTEPGRQRTMLSSARRHFAAAKNYSDMGRARKAGNEYLAGCVLKFIAGSFESMKELKKKKLGYSNFGYVAP